MVTRMLKIKDFGRDVEFNSVSELRKSLEENYKNNHVTILYTSKPHGLTHSVFVSVKDDGSITKTYGNQEFVDFREIESNLDI